MFGKGKKEKDIQKVLEGLTPEEKQDLLESLKADESNEQKGNETNENSTNGANPTETNESEKVVEGATTSNDNSPVEQEEQAQQEPTQPNMLRVEDVMLKSDFEKYLEEFNKRLDASNEKLTALEKHNADLEAKNNELAKENEDLKAKYENNSFGNYGNRANDDKGESNKKESFKDYADKYFK
jgi:hypothetical protein